MKHRQPQLTWTSRLLLKGTDATEAWRPATQWAVVFGALAAICAIDLFTGVQIALMFLYILVAGLAAWCFGESRGFLFGLFVAICGVSIRHYQTTGHIDHVLTHATEIWNLFARAMTNSLVVVLVCGMRSALALERWRASTDGLTGVLNKASFHSEMERKLAKARGSDGAFILCYMDLDGFKLVNDRHGHSAGDEVLRVFATAAVDAIREDDLFARIGGDEFVALLAIPSMSNGDHVVTLVHRRLSTILVRTGLSVGCSMGALVATADQLTPLEAAIQLADSMMYEVKRSGKAALRVGRLDPSSSLVAPDRLEIEPETDASVSTSARSRTTDRRVA